MKVNSFSLLLISVLIFGLLGAGSALATYDGYYVNYCQYAELDKTDHSRTVCLGAEFTYDISIDFNESAAEANVTVLRVTDILPPGVDFVSATDGGVYDASRHKVYWRFEDPDLPKTLGVTVRESSGEIGTWHKNTAIARFVILPDGPSD
ncbi:putative repeat protein (TIGR01451 family) [Methanohalophilus levihalophilus]|uniref:DUF11 domain-containing protein n=1 Tax=Methanohalophilus levihalophilus TaxID=1431282 RepID=UPI001AE5709A|nr:DUF11 domain-containing protein [Methanohalophilus levihalophilus]MBP2029534.1 putative repeat protein (TIGR01451 family) [Methanohalophilus levihalophilus]